MDDLGNLDCNRQSGKASESESWSIGEAFHIDDLLDFSNEDIGGPIGSDEAFSDSSVTEVEACSESPERNCRRGIRTPNVVEADGHLHSEELYVPNDALEELEWLSKFIDDSDVCTDDAQELAPASGFGRPDDQLELAVKENQCKQSAASVALENRASCVLSPRKAVPGRARSKRPRGTANHFSPFCNTGFETRSAVFVNVVLVENRSSQAEASVYSRPAKKAKKGTQIKKTQDASQARRCSHCLSQKTPQWRTGPLGPKTLCNACGVRFKSGRLLPEYRPALSPTFLSEIHSNCHRKVVEIRRQKERQQREQTPSLKAETSSVDGMAEAAEGERGLRPMS